MTSAPSLWTRRVLIVEDDVFMAELLRFVLERQGMTVTALSDGADAMEQVAGPCDQDLVMLDLLLPRHHGLDVLARLRASPMWHRVPVLVLSALDKGEDIARAFTLGADDFVTKPFNPDELLARLGRLLSARVSGERS